MKPPVRIFSGGTSSCLPTSSIPASRSLSLHLYALIFALLLVEQSTGRSQSTAPDSVQLSLAQKSSESAWVGQRVTVYLEVLSETFFAGPTKLSLPDIAGAVFYKPEERAIVSSKTIAGQTYSVQMHELFFYPQRAGEFEIPPFKVRFGVAGKPGEDAIEYSEQTKALKIAAKMPPGAEHLSVLISATDLKVTESWNPQPADKITVGDAFKRSITFRAPDMPGMAFPAINFPQIEGIKLYQARASVSDKIDRGALTGERTDMITYLCEKPGSYTIPAIAIPWWDLNNKQMNKIILPAINFDVMPGEKKASLDIERQNTSSAFPWKLVLGLIALLLLMMTVLYLYRKTIHQSYTDWQTRRRESEQAYFNKISKATTPAQTLNAVAAWLARSNLNNDSLSLLSFATEQNDSELSAQFQALQSAVVSDKTEWNPSPFIEALRKARHSALNKSDLQARPALKPLNP